MKTNESQSIRPGVMPPTKREGVTTPQGLLEEVME